MQRTANENAAGLRRLCKRSDQPKIERIANNDAKLITISLDTNIAIYFLRYLEVFEKFRKC